MGIFIQVALSTYLWNLVKISLCEATNTTGAEIVEFSRKKFD